MSLLSGLAVTAVGRDLLTKLAATGKALTLTKVLFGSGTLADTADLAEQTALVNPFAEGVFTSPLYDGNTLQINLQFRSDLNGGLSSTFWINEFGLFAEDDGSEVLLIYGNLGDCPESVPAYQSNLLVSRDYPVSVVIGAVPDVQIKILATAYMTSQDAKELMDTCLAHGVQMEALTPCGVVGEDLWLEDENGGYYCDLPREEVTADYVPFLALLSSCKKNAYQCGLDRIETFNGYLRLHCVEKTALPVVGTCVLFHKGIDTPITYFEMPIATENTLGGVRASESVVVDDNGIASVTLTEDDFATEAEIDAAISEGLS